MRPHFLSAEPWTASETGRWFLCCPLWWQWASTDFLHLFSGLLVPWSRCLGLYWISFFQSSRSRILPDLEWQIRPEPELQIDCNFTNLMCKNVTNLRVIWVFDYFLCSSYHYIIYMHSRSNLCRSNVSQVKSSQVAFNEWVWQSHKLTIKIQYMINVQTQKT